ncbi:hypothetical protein C8R46DRAFT_1096884 [Mycena filopes]|nr:hypothetical protein C8R46DRAFT_1096884 [Mycena filopes]
MKFRCLTVIESSSRSLVDSFNSINVGFSFIQVGSLICSLIRSLNLNIHSHPFGALLQSHLIQRRFHRDLAPLSKSQWRPVPRVKPAATTNDINPHLTQRAPTSKPQVQRVSQLHSGQNSPRVPKCWRTSMPRHVLQILSFWSGDFFRQHSLYSR